MEGEEMEEEQQEKKEDEALETRVSHCHISHVPPAASIYKTWFLLLLNQILISARSHYCKMPIQGIDPKPCPRLSHQRQNSLLLVYCGLAVL
jgi:hypothetical protein